MNSLPRIQNLQKLPRARMKRTLVTVVAALFVATVGGCSSSGDGGGSDEAPTEVALVQAHMASTFRTQMIKGAERVADENELKLSVYNSNNEVIKQNEAIQNYVQRGVDVIAVAAIEFESVLPAVRAASDEGVSIIAVDMLIDDPAVVANVGVDNRAGGATMGELVVESAKDSDVSDPTVGIVGALNSEIQNARKDGFIETVEATVEVVQTVDAQNRQEKAVDEAENLLRAHPDLTYIYATGEPAFIGTLAAIESQGRQDVKVYGWDLSAESIVALDKGLVEAIANQPAEAEGAKTMELAAAIAAGEEIERDHILEIDVVTTDNVDEYRSDYSGN